MSEQRQAARLALEDGSVWLGTAFGSSGTATGEIVFNTSMTGYQEILTDPSYAGQMVVMTAPQIGNTGINNEDNEARQIFLRGFIIRELSPCPANWRATTTLDETLTQQGILGIAGLDTRALTRRLRDQGSLKGVLSTDETLTDDDLIAQARAWEGLDGIDMAATVTCDAPYEWSEDTAEDWEFRQWADQWEAQNLPAPPPDGYRVVAVDFGIKRNILRRLATYGCRVTVVPANTTAAEIMALDPDGVFLSNGPGDPAAVSYAVETVKTLLGQVPIFGICLGHQILARALGGATYRLKFGHHGGNQPVKHLPTGRVEISAHNHNFAADPASLPPDVEVTHVNLNDDCCEGLRHTVLPALSIQYHPEAAPGPHDADPLFAEFIQMMAASPESTR